MSARWRWAAWVLVGLMMPLAAPAAGEQEVRAGIVTAVEPVATQAVAVSKSTRRQLGGMLGRAVGQAAGGRTGHSYEVTRAAGSLGSDLAGGDGGAGARAARVLLIRFDDASESAFTRSADQVGRFRVGSRVKVIGTGDAAILLPE